jgi:hypothetical protein
MHILFLMIWAHALADFPLQGDFLAKAKDPTAVLMGTGERIWLWCMGAHCLIHAGFVAVITGNIWLGLAEFAAHWLIDYTKCCRRISFGQDQALHIGCKILWFVLALTL